MDAQCSRMGTKILRKLGSKRGALDGALTRNGVYNVGQSHFNPETSASRTYNLCVVGFGKVGKAFVALLHKKQLELNRRYGIAYRVTGISSGRLGWLAAPQGFTAEKILAGDFSEAHSAAEVHDWLRLGKPMRCLKRVP
jgi:hypothetical protein